MTKLFSLALLIPLLLSQPRWYTNMEEAQRDAASTHKHILLNFSGSDWCGPCIVLRKEVLDDPAFLAMADTSLVLLNADFPRMKKNQLPKTQQQANDKLADRYNPQGKFPLTLLLTAEGKVLRQWEGNPGLKPAEFSAQVLSAIGPDNRD